MENQRQKDCVCDRPRGCVFCRNCGHLEVGRLKLHCPCHPHTIFLYDVSRCSKCMSPDFMLREMRKFH
ncbi:uncharacterized protein CG13380 [Leptopilina boulardi]|uniref:uncharacterized protein CG13380 n=1 Tax=Leptopilina boulardi TaxID=63433 RepID=UPI0021F5A10E|nr:uncharacterized protein CG13380 [Leptopilina boulardi]